MDYRFLDKKDTYSLLLSAIYATSGDARYMLLSDLIYALDNENFKNFLALFEGQTLKIPTMSEITAMLSALMIYTYHDINRIPLREALRMLHLDPGDSASYKGPAEYLKLKAALREKKIEIGGVFDGFPSEKASSV